MKRVTVAKIWIRVQPLKCFELSFSKKNRLRTGGSSTPYWYLYSCIGFLQICVVSRIFNVTGVERMGGQRSIESQLAFNPLVRDSHKCQVPFTA